MRRLLLLIFFLTLGISASRAQTYRAWVNAANKSLSERHYAEAISHFLKASEFEVEDLAVYFGTAEAFRLYNDYDRAAAWYTKVVLADKENQYPLALFYLAEMRKFIGQYPESRQLYEKYASLHPGDTTYYVTKARYEAQNMNESIRISDTSANVKVENAGSPINSVYSDFAGAFAADSVYYYSSLRFLFENTGQKNTSYYVTRILKTSMPQPAPAPLGLSVNLPELHNSNMAISPDGKFMVFARCPESGDYRLKCELYESRFENGVWSKPVKIAGKVNITEYTSTQPALTTRGADGYKLYFASDRPGGYGKTDIWVSDRDMSGNYTDPVNAGTPVNTFDEESTPWFDATAQELYFSSYGHPGMGGLDVFKSTFNGSAFTEPVNLLPPVNSSANDLYFSRSSDTSKGSFSSNRKGSMYISSQTCCYDIYFMTILPPDTSKDGVDTTAAVAVVPENHYERKSYDDFLPLVLYFENDQPDPRTRKEATQSDYLSLYESYLDNRPTYLSQFTKGLTGEEKDKAAGAIEQFFDAEVIASFKRLEGFCAKLERAMKDSVELTLEVRGRASPLAKTDYNEILSKRRISSLVNYLMIYREGVLKTYIESGQLVVKEVPAGESMAGTGISDELKDQRNSVYNPAAAIERRIELINVVIKNER